MMYIFNCTKHLLQANTSILPRIPKNIETVRNRTMSGIGPTTVFYNLKNNFNEIIEQMKHNSNIFIIWCLHPLASSLRVYTGLWGYHRLPACHEVIKKWLTGVNIVHYSIFCKHCRKDTPDDATWVLWRLWKQEAYAWSHLRLVIFLTALPRAPCPQYLLHLVNACPARGGRSPRR